MQMWLLKPPDFDDKKKWPLVYLIHGGPQGAWEDGWSFRWNAQLWAAQGYVVAMPNPRGSTGFGQKYVDEITGDWGGKCYRDLVAGLDYLKKLPYVDADRLATAGASFGGYMQMWFAVNDIAKNFKCQICHDGVWNFESMWGTTDELWFDEWEHGGLPWEKPRKYREVQPAHPGRRARQEQGADAHHPQRSRFPLPDRPGARVLRGPAAAGRAEPPGELPGRRPLGAQAREQQALAQRSLRLAEAVLPAGREVMRLAGITSPA